MAKRFSRRLLFGYSVSKVEDYIQQQAEHWKQECEKRDQHIRRLEQELAQLNEQLRVRQQQDEALVKALAHAERMSQNQSHEAKSGANAAEGDMVEKTQIQKRVEEAIRKNLQSLETLRSRLEKNAPAPDPLADALEALETGEEKPPAVMAQGLGAAFPGADLAGLEQLDSPDWRGMLHREYQQPEPPALEAARHAQLEQVTRELGIE